MVCGLRGGGLYGKLLKHLVAKPLNSLHARPSRYAPDSSVGNLWYKNNFSRMPGSWRFHVAFCRTNIPPCVEGVCDVLCGVVECKRRRGAMKNQSSSKTSLISHTVHYTGTFHMGLKGIEFPHFYISLHVPVCFDGEAIHSPLHMQKCAVI